jgi:guanylate cyclase, other
MGVTNLEGTQDRDHVKVIAEFALAAIEAAGKVLIDEEDPSKGYIRIRVGFHSGPVVSNVIGRAQLGSLVATFRSLDI